MLRELLTALVGYFVKSAVAAVERAVISGEKTLLLKPSENRIEGAFRYVGQHFYALGQAVSVGVASADDGQNTGLQKGSAKGNAHAKHLLYMFDNIIRYIILNVNRYCKKYFFIFSAERLFGKNMNTIYCKRHRGDKVENISKNLDENIKHMKDVFKNDNTFISRPLETGGGLRCCAFFCDGMVSTPVVNEAVIKPLVLWDDKIPEGQEISFLKIVLVELIYLVVI